MNASIEDLLEDVAALKKEVAEIRAELNFYKLDRNIQRDDENHDYYFYKDKQIAICPCCWEKDHKITPVADHDDNGYFTCERCGYQGVYNRKKLDVIDEMQTTIFKKLFDDK